MKTLALLPILFIILSLTPEGKAKPPLQCPLITVDTFNTGLIKGGVYVVPSQIEHEPALQWKIGLSPFPTTNAVDVKFSKGPDKEGCKYAVTLKNNQKIDLILYPPVRH